MVLFLFFSGGEVRSFVFLFVSSKSHDNFPFFFFSFFFLWSEVSNNAAVPYSLMEKVGSVGHIIENFFEHPKTPKTALLGQRKTHCKIEKHEGDAAAAAAAHDPVGKHCCCLPSSGAGGCARSGVVVFLSRYESIQ